MFAKLILLASFLLVLNFTVSTDAAVDLFQEIGGMVVMEGEHFTGADGRNDENRVEWRISTATAGFVGDGYADTPPPQGTNGAWANSCEITFEIQFSTGGTYSIWVRRYAPDGASNSVWVGLDGVQMGTKTIREITPSGFGRAWGR